MKTALIVLIVIVTFLSWGLLRAYETIGASNKLIASKDNEIARSTSQLLGMNMLSKMNDAYQAELQSKNEQITATSATRTIHVNKVIHDKAENRSWADTPLPSDIIRLHTRPTLVGADAYLKYLSDNNTLHVNGQ